VTPAARSAVADRAGLDIGEDREENQNLWLGVSGSERSRDAQGKVRLVLVCRGKAGMR